MISSKSISPYRLYLVVSKENCRHLDYFDIIETALRNGFTCLQLREKKMATREFIKLAQAVKVISSKYKVPLFINDCIDVALSVGATGVHLGQSDLPYTLARKISGQQLKIGITLETPTDFLNHQFDAIDYFGLSSIHPSKTKLDCKLLWQKKDILRLKTKIPLIGIGGITTLNAQHTLSMGLDGLALVSDICSSSSIQEVKNKTQFFKSLLKDIGYADQRV